MRAHYRNVVQDTAGNLNAGASVAVYQPGTTTFVTGPLYADGSSGSTLTNPFTSADGSISFYLASPQRVDIGVTPAGGQQVIFKDIDLAVPSADVLDWINVIGYGADPTGTVDSTSAIQAALNAVPANGGTVYFPDGIYLISATLNPTVTGTSLVGAGWGAQIRYDGSVVPAAIGMADTTTRRVNVRWMRISQTNASHLGTAIEASYFTNGAIEHVLIDGGGTSGVAPLIGVSFNSATTFYNVVSESRINCGGANSIGVRFDTAANSNVVRNCRILPDASVSSSIGVYVNSRAIELDHVDIESSAGTGVSIGATGHGCTLIAPYLEANGTNLAFASGANAPTVIGGTIEAATTADYADSGALTPTLINVRSSAGGEHAYTKASTSPVFQPDDHAVLAWSYDPAVTSNSTAVASGTVQLIKIVLRRAATISNLYAQVNTAGGTLTSGQNFAGLYSASGTLLSATADQTTAWGSTGMKTMALTTPQTVLPGYYYVALLSNGTTGPAFARGNGLSGAANAINLGLAASTARFATGPTAQTSLPSSITMSSNSLAGVPYWVAVS